MAVFRMTKPAGILGAGGLVRFVRGSWFGYPIAGCVLCRRHVQSLICARSVSLSGVVQLALVLSVH